MAAVLVGVEGNMQKIIIEGDSFSRHTEDAVDSKVCRETDLSGGWVWSRH